MLNVSHVTKKYGKVLACDDLSFHLDPGTVTVLLGPNGAGKSTIIKAMIGFLKYEGEITVKNFSNKTPQARRMIGYIPEMPSLYPNLTVSEHMEFIARAYKLGGNVGHNSGNAGSNSKNAGRRSVHFDAQRAGRTSSYQARIDELFERFELSDKRKKFGDELSKGMQQKLNICLGLLPDPQVLLLDEPMIGLDPHAIKELKLLIEEMRQEGKTILVSTHMIDSVDMLWDRTIIMKEGKIQANLTRDELAADGRSLEQLFFDITEGSDSGDASADAAESGDGSSGQYAESSDVHRGSVSRREGSEEGRKQ
ncbi:MAG: ABC transporter ATP-binding protein [Lachnospiraceae bacterium]|nr:ABC transporter ATP-binding protein [Lachnospiraceae bacterium]